jgi:hypothetical protein
VKPNENADRAHFQRSGWQDTEPPKPSEIFGRILNCPNHPNCGNQAAETFFRPDSKKLTAIRLLDEEIPVMATVPLSFRTPHTGKSLPGNYLLSTIVADAGVSNEVPQVFDRR